MDGLSIVLYHGHGGCYTYTHFQENWVQAKGLHPELKKVPVTFVEVECLSDERIEIMLDDERQGAALNALALHELNYELAFILNID